MKNSTLLYHEKCLDFRVTLHYLEVIGGLQTLQGMKPALIASSVLLNFIRFVGFIFPTLTVLVKKS